MLIRKVRPVTATMLARCHEEPNQLQPSAPPGNPLAHGADRAGIDSKAGCKSNRQDAEFGPLGYPRNDQRERGGYSKASVIRG